MADMQVDPRDLIMLFALSCVGIGVVAAASAGAASSSFVGGQTPMPDGHVRNATDTAPALCEEDAFWRRNHFMMDRQSHDTSWKVGSIMQHITRVERRLNQMLKEETRVRAGEAAAMTTAMQDPSPKVSRSSRPDRDQGSQQEGVGAWRATHAMLGGGSRDAEREELERQALEWIQGLPEAERAAYTRPCARRRYRSTRSVSCDRTLGGSVHSRAASRRRRSEQP